MAVGKLYEHRALLIKRICYQRNWMLSCHLFCEASSAMKNIFNMHSKQYPFTYMY